MTNPTKREYPALTAKLIHEHFAPDIANTLCITEWKAGIRAAIASSAARSAFNAYADPLLDKIDSMQQNMENIYTENKELRATIEHLTQSRATLEAQYNQLYELSGNQADTIERQREALEWITDQKPATQECSIVHDMADCAITALQAELEKK